MSGVTVGYLAEMDAGGYVYRAFGKTKHEAVSALADEWEKQDEPIPFVDAVEWSGLSTTPLYYGWTEVV